MRWDEPRELPGYKKKSFVLPYAGGEIWIEHLDGIYGNSDLVLEKLQKDRCEFSRPSLPSCIGFVLDETEVTPAIIAAISDALLHTQKIIRRVCFIGADQKTEKALKTALKTKTFALAFNNDLEKAKEWLV
jgi:hypothetical protein